MTNLEKIKTTLCNTINSMSEEELFEFISDYDGCEDPYFPIEVLFTCEKCRELYGDCEAHVSGSVNYQTCIDRFNNYCRAECE